MARLPVQALLVRHKALERQQIVSLVARAGGLDARWHVQSVLSDTVPLTHEVLGLGMGDGEVKTSICVHELARRPSHRVGGDICHVVVAPGLVERDVAIGLEQAEILHEALGVAVERPEGGVLRRSAGEHLAG